MRMRKLPWADAYIAQADVVLKQPTQMVGQWKKQLQCKELHVEIGTGKGDYWIQMAQSFPQAGWVGIEKNSNVAALAVRKYHNLQETMQNMLFIQEDAQNIQTWFAKGEIDVIHLNFSDPWPKKRAHKKRLSNHMFIAQYAYILQENGAIQMKTDNSDLFEYSILEFQREGWFLQDISVDFRRNEHPEDAISEYEQRFMKQQKPIYRAIWMKHAMEKENIL